MTDQDRGAALMAAWFILFAILLSWALASAVKAQ
jgi:hypothetical protein